MSERNGLRESDANFRESWLTAEEAAGVLSVSVRTVQKRAREGKLPSRTEGRRLLVCVPVREGDAKIRENGASVRESPVTDTEESALVKHLRSENAYLRERIAAHERAEEQWRTIMLAERQSRLLSPAPPEVPPAAQDTPPDASTGISERERAAGVYQDGHDGKPPITGVADQPERRSARRWWNNLFGKRGR